MKKIEAIINPGKLEVVRDAFVEAGIKKMTVTEVRDYGNQKAHTEIYRTNAFSTDSHNKVKVETIVPQNKIPIAVNILRTKGHTGKGENDTISISSVNDLGRMQLIKQRFLINGLKTQTEVHSTHIMKGFP